MPTPPTSHPLAALTPYVYGTTRLGHDDVSRSDRLAMARVAAESGVWFHTSRQYDDTLEVLGEVYGAGVTAPPTIYKIGGESIATIRQTIADNLEPVGQSSMAIGQLSPGGPFGEGFATGDAAIIDGLAQIKADGLVENFIMEVFPWTSDAPYRALRDGHAAGVVDAYIFYLNPLQRFVTNELWDLMVDLEWTMISMRTVAGGPVHRLRDVPGAAWQPYLQQRAVEVAPIFERSGIVDWTEFCVRFAHSFPQVISTVGSTSRPEALEAYLSASRGEIAPLAADIVAEISALQRRWSTEVDVLAEPWTM